MRRLREFPVRISPTIDGKPFVDMPLQMERQGMVVYGSECRNWAIGLERCGASVGWVTSHPDRAQRSGVRPTVPGAIEAAVLALFEIAADLGAIGEVAP